MKSLDDYRKPKFVAYCKAALETFGQETPGIKNVLLATPDGFEISAHITTTDFSEDNLAAVASSMYALGASMTAELHLNQCNAITIDSEDGKIYIRGVSKGEDNLVLLVQSNQNAMLAHILHGSNKLANQIIEQL